MKGIVTFYWASGYSQTLPIGSCVCGLVHDNRRPDRYSLQLDTETQIINEVSIRKVNEWLISLLNVLSIQRKEPTNVVQRQLQFPRGGA